MNHTPGLSLEDIEYICNKLTFDDVSVRIRKHLREHARLIAAAPRLLKELMISIERGFTLGYECEDELELFKSITDIDYEAIRKARVNNENKK